MGLKQPGNCLESSGTHSALFLTSLILVATFEDHPFGATVELRSGTAGVRIGAYGAQFKSRWPIRKLAMFC